MQVQFKTTNAAFYDMDGESLDFSAVADVLRDVVKALENGRNRGTLRDYNGNTIGSWSIQEDN